MLAVMVHPCLELERSEAKSGAAVLREVQKHYPNIRIMSDKQMALFALAVWAGNTYIPRALVVTGMKKYDPTTHKVSSDKNAVQVSQATPIPANVAAQAAPTPFAPGNPVMNAGGPVIGNPEDALKFFDPVNTSKQ